MTKLGTKSSFSARFDGFFFVSYNDFVVGNFDDFFSWNGEFRVNEAFHNGAFYDDLLNEEIVGICGEINDLAKFGTFFGFNFEGEEIEIKF